MIKGAPLNTLHLNLQRLFNISPCRLIDRKSATIQIISYRVHTRTQTRRCTKFHRNFSKITPFRWNTRKMTDKQQNHLLNRSIWYVQVDLTQELLSCTYIHTNLIYPCTTLCRTVNIYIRECSQFRYLHTQPYIL